MNRDIGIAVIVLAIAVSLTYFFLPRHGVIVYNCSIAEISPDFPIEVKEECRKRNAQKI